MLGLSSSVSSGISFLPSNPKDELRTLERTIEELWNEHPDELFNYEDLNQLVKPDGIIKLEQNDLFFVITHPNKINTFKSNAPFLGWKLHISVAARLISLNKT